MSQGNIDTPKQLLIHQKSEHFPISCRSFSGSPSLIYATGMAPEILPAHVKIRLCWEGQSSDMSQGLPLADPDHCKLWEEK